MLSMSEIHASSVTEYIKSEWKTMKKITQTPRLRCSQRKKAKSKNHEKYVTHQ